MLYFLRTNNIATVHFFAQKEVRVMSNEIIKIAINGYGNLGRGAEIAIANSKDMELAAIFTRRNPEEIAKQTSAKVVSTEDAIKYVDDVDVMIMAGGSATDLPKQVPEFAKMFSTVDSFDTHKKIPEYLAAVDEQAKKGGNVSIISVGWDPGLFSTNRLYMESILFGTKAYSFWGKGVSQGHSDAIRRINGVKDARQDTIPIPEAVERVRNGENPDLSDGEKHTRVCYVVAEEGADQERIRKEIVEMPNYFAPYDTTVNFITEEELKANYSGLPHGGFVLCTGETSPGIKQAMEFKLNLDSNPEFTGAVLAAYARAAYRMKKEGQTGARTVFDVSPVMLYPGSREEAIRKLL